MTKIPSTTKALALLSTASLLWSCQKSSSSSDDPPPPPPETQSPALVDGSEPPAPVAPPGPDGNPQPPATPANPADGSGGETPPADPPPPEGASNGETPPPEPVEPPPPPPTQFTEREVQFWKHTRAQDGGLIFNTPWDEEEGDSIVRDETKTTPAARDCLRRSREKFNRWVNKKEPAALIRSLLAQGAAPQIIHMIVVADADNLREPLRAFDRDAYFWHWNEDGKKPSLATSQFKKGAFVWESIAFPLSCLMPDESEALRYLQYVESRINAKGVVLP